MIEFLHFLVELIIRLQSMSSLCLYKWKSREVACEYNMQNEHTFYWLYCMLGINPFIRLRSVILKLTLLSIAHIYLHTREYDAKRTRWIYVRITQMNCIVSFSGIGYAICLIDVYMGMYYNTIIGWAVYYLYASFTYELPWTSCNNEWNTPLCKPVSQQANLTNATSPAREFFEWVNLAVVIFPIFFLFFLRPAH